MRQLAIDLLGLVGFGAFAYGLHQVYPPAAFIACGLSLTAYAVIASAKKRSDP